MGFFATIFLAIVVGIFFSSLVQLLISYYGLKNDEDENNEAGSDEDNDL